ncbi:MAG: hypothetical protein ACRC7C_18125, partial [Beijerinckiaceae bacterium]
MGLSDVDPLLVLVKMLSTATIVVVASLIAERTGPLIAAMVATLPVSAGPVYFFLAMEHDDAFIADAALGSMGSNFATTVFAVVYVSLAQRLSTAAALGITFCCWAMALMGTAAAGLPFTALAAIVAIAFPIAHHLVAPYLAARPRSAPKLAWYAVPLRAMLVAALVATVTTISTIVGPTWSGLLATFPIVLSTLIIFLQPRIGGPATAAIIGSGVLGLMGFGVALGVLHLA